MCISVGFVLISLNGAHTQYEFSYYISVFVVFVLSQASDTVNHTWNTNWQNSKATLVEKRILRWVIAWKPK